MASLPPLFIELKANVGEFTSKMGDARSEVEKLQKSGSDRFGQLASVGKAAFLGLGAAAVAFGVSAVKVGIDQEEANARLTTALHNTGSAMTALSEPVEAAEARMRRLGFTNGDTTDSLATLTNATHNPTKALGDLGLAADIARARHIDLSTATDLLAKVETGHVALLGRLGINTKDATGATISQTEAIKRLSDMYGGQADAYSKTFAGRMAELKAQVENVQEQVGLWLIPKIEALVRVGAGAIDWAERNKTAAEVLAAVIGGPLVIAMGAYIVQQGILLATKVASFFMTAAGAVGGFLQAIGTAVPGVESMSTAMVVGGLAVAGLAAGFGFLISQMQASQQAANRWAVNFATAAGPPQQQIVAIKAKMHELQDEIDQSGVAAHIPFVRMATGAQQTENKIHALKAQLEALTAQQEGHKKSAEADAGAIDGTGDAAGGATSKVADLAEQTGLSADRVDLLARKLGIDLSKSGADAAEKIAALNDRLKYTSPSAEDLGAAMQTLADKTADAKEKASAFKTALDLLIGGNIDAERATVNFYNSIDQLGAKILANKSDFDVHTKAGRDNISMVEDSVTSIRNHIEAMKNQGFTADQLQAAFAGDTDALRKQLEQSGLTKAQIDRLIQSYNLVPASLNTVISANTDPAQKAWDDLMAAAQPYLNLLKNLPAVDVKGYAGGITVPHFAAGGSFGPGDFMAGEEGPEFIHVGPDGRGYVKNAGQTRAMFSTGMSSGPIRGGGGTTIVLQPGAVVVQGSVTTERDLVDAIHEGLLSKQQRQPLGFTS